jgi:tRNA pseudouridine55 synthase
VSRPRDGVLLVDKPIGPTSHDIVRAARARLRLRRIGHAGTLDPFASGLLVLCLGSSTRISQYLSAMDKSYLATARLGVSTSTHDLEGDVVDDNPRWRELDERTVHDALEALRGPLLQLPPRYSAKKVQGTAAHRRARRGETVELEPVPVEVYEIRETRCALPFVTFAVRCSSGTYVRALARDLGTALGTGAHLTELRRIGVGAMHVRDAVPADELREEVPPAAHLSAARALAHLPAVRVGEEDAARLACGQAVEPTLDPVPEADPVVALEGGTLVAIGVGRGGVLRPRKVFR